MSDEPVIYIATRGSALALAQANKFSRNAAPLFRDVV